MGDNDSVKKTLFVAIGLCLLCSIFVSLAAVKLKDKQNENVSLDIKKNMLMASGLIKDSHASKEDILSAYTKITPVMVDLASGEILKDVTLQQIESFNSNAQAKDPELGKSIETSKDLAGIKQREKRSPVYLIKDENQQIEQIIFQVRGKGLWSTMYGFFALDKDLNTIRGLTFYQHGETPGLGGEVDNPLWKALWPGKKLYNPKGEMSIELIKGKASEGMPNFENKVDGLAGATITSRGVTNLVRYWLGLDGYGPFLEKIRQNGGRP